MSCTKSKYLILMLFLILALSGCGQATATTSLVEEPIDLYPAYQMENGKILWGYIDSSGFFVIRPTYDRVEAFNSNGLAEIVIDGYSGLINQQGVMITTQPYQDIYPFNESVAVAKVSEMQYDILDDHGLIVGSVSGVKVEEGTVCHEGLIRFFYNTYGYMTPNGTVAIAANYPDAKDFSEGKAVVKLASGGTALIDKAGRVLYNYFYEDVVSSGKSLMGFIKYGDLDSVVFFKDTGDVIRKADIDSIYPYEDGVSIVGQKSENELSYGLLDEEGKQIVPFSYKAMRYLGDGIFAVVKDTRFNNDEAFLKQKAALMDQTGKLLTEEKYYNPHWYGDGKISVTDGMGTFLIDTKGNEVSKIKILGVGRLRKVGSLVEAQIDNTLKYYNEKGKLIWQPEQVQIFKNGLMIVEKTKRTNPSTVVKYPEIAGVSSYEVQTAINKDIRRIFEVPVYKQDATLEEDQTVGYMVRIDGNLLGVERISRMSYNDDAYSFSSFPLMSKLDDKNEIIMDVRSSIQYDVTNGVSFDLEDLFILNSNYAVLLPELIKKKIEDGLIEGPLTQEDIVLSGFDHPYRCEERGLVLFFNAKSNGNTCMVTIPWEDLATIVNKEGPLWTAYWAK